jgi:hypothetical protein
MRRVCSAPASLSFAPIHSRSEERMDASRGDIVVSEREMRPTVESGTLSQGRSATTARILWAVALVMLLGAGLGLGFMGLHAHDAAGSVGKAGSQHGGSFSSGRTVEAPPNVPAAGAGHDDADREAAARAHAEAAKVAIQQAEQSAQRLAAAQQAQEVARQQAEQLAAKQHELEQMASDQAAQTQRIAAENARLEAEKANIQEARLEAGKAAARANLGTRARPAYSGPNSGTLIWQGEVRGTTLVTITGAEPDQGRLLSAGLPGVPVLLQPNDGKHVVVASTPSPSNGYQRLTLRVQGNGVVQQSIHWSLP